MKIKALLIFAFCFNSNNVFAALSNADMQLNQNNLEQKDDAQKQNIIKQLEILDSSIIKINQEIKNNEDNINNSKKEIELLEKDQAKLEKTLEDELSHFNKVTTNILKIAQIPAEVTILQDTLQLQQKRFGALAMLKNQLMLDIRNSKSDLSDLSANLEEQKQKKLDLSEIQNRLDTKRIEFYELRKQQKSILRLPAEIRLKMEKDAVLLANDLNLDKFLNTIKTKSVRTSTNLSNEKLPIEGKIIENFHDQDRITQVPVQGITVEGFARGKIRSLHDGRVIYSGVFREYGHLVILEHQSGAHSLYAGFGRAIVDVGDYVNAGDLMGFLPGEEEPTLYYEVRINNIAQDPKLWLEKDLNIL